MTESPTAERQSTREWALRSLVMNECSVARGDGDATAPERVEIDHNVDCTPADSEAVYVVSTRAEFADRDGGTVATINVSFAATYDLDTENTPDELLRAFLPSVILHVTPFEREFLASMTNRLAMQPFYLPLVRADEVNTN